MFIFMVYTKSKRKLWVFLNILIFVASVENVRKSVFIGRLC